MQRSGLFSNIFEMITLILQLLQVTMPNSSHICFPLSLSNTIGLSGPCKSLNSLSLRSTKYWLPPKHMMGRPLQPVFGCLFRSFIVSRPAKPVWRFAKFTNRQSWCYDSRHFLQIPSSTSSEVLEKQHQQKCFITFSHSLQSFSLSPGLRCFSLVKHSSQSGLISSADLHIFLCP